MTTLRIERIDDVIDVVTLDRPQRLNALDDELLAELGSYFEDVANDVGVHAIVLTGAGRGFCAGLDIRSFEPDAITRDGATGALIRQRRVSRMITAAHRVPVPMIGAINGPVAGGGYSLALACDVRVASPAATFTTAYITLGLAGGELGMTFLLPKVVGLGVASELMLTSRTIHATEAHRIGLVNDVVEPEDLVARAIEDARRITSFGRLAASITRQTIRGQLGVASLEAAMELEDRTQSLLAFDGGPQRLFERMQGGGNSPRTSN
jgi:enoyl-CoA hydratase